jgi:CRP-like cAMP-binding protein
MLDNPLIRKLETVGTLPDVDKRALVDVCDDVREFSAKRDIIREGARPDFVHLVLEGWAARYKLVPSGRRQITAFLVPGDFCDLHITVLQQMDHSITSITPTKIACIPAKVMKELPETHPSLTRALWWSTLVDEAVLREWLVSAGRRNAYEAVAHILCELHARLKRVGLVEGHHFELPVTQEELADALGLTAVHVNRMLQRLRMEGLVQLEKGRLAVLDSLGLCKVAGFDPSYLHPEKLRFDR